MFDYFCFDINQDCNCQNQYLKGITRKALYHVNCQYFFPNIIFLQLTISYNQLKYEKVSSVFADIFLIHHNNLLLFSSEAFTWSIKVVADQALCKQQWLKRAWSSILAQSLSSFRESYSLFHNNRIQVEPYFDNNTQTNVTTSSGKTAFLPCLVRNLGDQTVSQIYLVIFNILRFM